MIARQFVIDLSLFLLLVLLLMFWGKFLLYVSHSVFIIYHPSSGIIAIHSVADLKSKYDHDASIMNSWQRHWLTDNTAFCHRSVSVSFPSPPSRVLWQILLFVPHSVVIRYHRSSSFIQSPIESRNVILTRQLGIPGRALALKRPLSRLFCLGVQFLCLRCYPPPLWRSALQDIVRTPNGQTRRTAPLTSQLVCPQAYIPP